ncbi:trigger factor [Thiomonas sp.]|uniref:trigger factor n=1 Tax=Thiomonas sp. TaxID=2047785 RepID=UPI002623B9E3|nr:trigger factor [Thiomonas sp.]
MTVETLDKLQRRVTVTVPKAAVQTEINARLKNLSRTLRLPGFRPGKVPMSMVAQRYAPSVELEVLQDKIGNAFYEVASNARLRVAGMPQFTPKSEGVAEDVVAFDAVFEVYPDVQIPDLSAHSIERVTAEVDDAAIDKTIEVLRKQRVTFIERGQAAPDGQTSEGLEVQDGDRVTVDFEGRIDGTAFEGGKAEGFSFVQGEGRMLPEFEAATKGLQAGQSKIFELHFPEDYQGRAVAGKTAQFTLKVTKVEWPLLPPVDADFAKALGVADGDVQRLREDIRSNLQREVKARLTQRNKLAVMDLLQKAVPVDLPTALVDNEIKDLIAGARQDLAERGMKDADKAPLPPELFREQAERRVRLGLIVAELVKQHDLQAKPEQVRSYVEELAASYEQPEELVRWYYADPQRLSQAEAIVMENNVTDFVFSQAQTTDKVLSFDELMGRN